MDVASGLGLSTLDRRLMGAIERRGLPGFVAMVATLSIVLSEVITVAWLVAIDTRQQELVIGAATALVVPAIVAPLTAWTIGRLLQALAVASMELQHLADIDALTGTANRRSFAARAAELWERRDGGVVVVAMVDIDDFKAVNDRFGHAAGDLVLTTLAAALIEAVADGTDGWGGAVVGRLGGDEFAVVAVVPDHSSVAALGRRLDAACDLGHVRPGISATVGSLTVDVLDPTVATIDEALARADHALYAAKRPSSRVVSP